MIFKIAFLTALVAFAHAGGPAEYSISAPSIDGAFVGSSQEHTVKGYGGLNSHSTYSKAVDSAHSSVRVSSSRISNDIGYAPHAAYAPAAVKIAAHGPAIVSHAAIAAPAYASHAYAAPAYASHAYAAPAYASHAYAAPAYASHAYASPAFRFAAPSYAGHAIAAPAYASHSYAAPALKIAAPAAIATHSYAAPILASSYAPAHHYGTHLHGAAIAAPAAIKYAAAPAVAIGHGGLALGHGLATAHYAAAAPIAYKTAAAPLVHTSFVGHGAHYAY